MPSINFKRNPRKRTRGGGYRNNDHRGPPKKKKRSSRGGRRGRSNKICGLSPEEGKSKCLSMIETLKGILDKESINLMKLKQIKESDLGIKLFVNDDESKKKKNKNKKKMEKPGKK